MKKFPIFRFIASLALLLAGVFVSCSDSDSTDEATLLEVTPSTDIAFKAEGNQDINLTVKTNAASWEVDNSEWLIVKKDGNTLKVNAQPNTETTQRTGFISVSAGNATPVKINATQDASTGETILSVTPSEEVVFNAKNNEAVVFTVTTNASEWSFTAPEWLETSKKENKLTVKASDNTGEARNGEIVFKIPQSDKQVKIAVSQKAGNDSGVSVKGSLKFSDEGRIVFQHNSTEAVTKTLTLELDHPAGSDLNVKVSADYGYIDGYNFDNNTSYVALPEAVVALENNGILTVKAGQSSGSLKVTVTPGEQLEFITSYMCPLLAESQDEALTIEKTARYAHLFVSKTNTKSVRNVCFFEVNDTNPLNALEYVLENGQPFFDAVVLFAGNIKWNRESEKVYMHANPNVQALLDESDVYLQPLRKKGIKVLLGILGDHDDAGVANLSEMGSEKFADELGSICYEHGLDGVAFDDEYSNKLNSPANPWFTTTSKAAASRLLYETKNALKRYCHWETLVSIFCWGQLHSDMPAVTIDGQRHLPSEFIDMVCPNYGAGSGGTVEGMTDKSGCAGISIEFARGIGEMNEQVARNIVENKYGWVMWFAFDPSGSGSVENNLETAMKQFNILSNVCYNQRVLAPKNVYHKKGEGVYDPNPVALQ